ncbi:MAG TPA: hypothetical protein VJ801_02995 [Polyangia bacterium]|nr:hypothetical protein [Polyangia bacterium]
MLFHASQGGRDASMDQDLLAEEFHWAQGRPAATVGELEQRLDAHPAGIIVLGTPRDHGTATVGNREHVVQIGIRQHLIEGLLPAHVVGQELAIIKARKPAALLVHRLCAVVPLQA